MFLFCLFRSVHVLGSNVLEWSQKISFKESESLRRTWYKLFEKEFVVQHIHSLLGKSLGKPNTKQAMSSAIFFLGEILNEKVSKLLNLHEDELQLNISPGNWKYPFCSDGHIYRAHVDISMNELSNMKLR